MQWWTRYSPSPPVAHSLHGGTVKLKGNEDERAETEVCSGISKDYPTLPVSYALFVEFGSPQDHSNSLYSKAKSSSLQFNSLSLVLCSKNMQNNFNFLLCSVNLTKTSFSSFLGRHLRANSIYDYFQNESLKFSYDGKLEGKVVWNFPLLLILVKKTKHYRCGPSRFHFPRICSRNNGIYESSSPLTQKSD